MVFQFLRWLRLNVTEEQFKDILAATEQDIKFNRVNFGKRTNQITFINICTMCACAVLRCQYE